MNRSVALSVLAVALLLLRLPVVPAADAPAERRTSFARSVDKVCVAHDGRLWSQLAWRFDPEPTLTECKQLLERQFHEPAPRATNLHFALFDDRGRAWFYADGQRLLLGYDGKRWIERRAGPGVRFIGECSTAGQFLHGGSNRSIAGVQWFLDGNGIHRFDGEQWSYETFEPPKPAARGERASPANPWLAVSPDGRHVVASIWQSGRLRVYHEGRWTERPIPHADPQGVGSLVVTNGGHVWRLTPSSQLRVFSLSDDIPAIERRFPKLLAELAAAEYDRREAATLELIQLANYSKDRVEGAWKEATDPEVRRRLERVIRTVAQAAESRGIQLFAGRELTSPRYLAQDARDRLFVAADKVFGGDDARPGVIVADSEGQSRVLRNAAVTTSIRPHFAMQPQAIAAPAGDRLWISCLGTSRGACLFDLADDRVVDELGDARFGFLQAVDRDGKVYVTASSSVMVVNPHAPDTRTPLRVIASPWEIDFLRVADDGAVWAHRTDGDLVRFDGRDWRMMQSVDTHAIRFAAGADGVVLVGSESETFLYRHDRLVDRGDSAKELVRKHRDMLADTFARARIRAETDYGQMSLAVDRDRNIWFRSGETVEILQGERWVAIGGALVRDGAKQDECLMMAAAGDGGRILVSGSFIDRDQTFLGGFREGRLGFRRIPQAVLGYDTTNGLRERDGALWIAAETARGYGDGSGGRVINGYLALRYEGAGDPTEIKNGGWPILVDQSQNVWLHRGYARGDHRLTVWRDGRIAQELELPETDTIGAAFSDRPGSVYAWTATGLQHLVADDPEQPTWRPGRVYSIDGVPFTISRIDYSKLGYVVVDGARELPGRSRRVHLVELPKP